MIFLFFKLSSLALGSTQPHISQGLSGLSVMFLPNLKCRTVECVHTKAAQKREHSRSAQVTMVPALM